MEPDRCLVFLHLGLLIETLPKSSRSPSVVALLSLFHRQSNPLQQLHDCPLPALHANNACREMALGPPCDAHAGTPLTFARFEGAHLMT